MKQHNPSDSNTHYPAFPLHVLIWMVLKLTTFNNNFYHAKELRENVYFTPMNN